jgi:hypothetical protein
MFDDLDIVTCWDEMISLIWSLLNSFIELKYYRNEENYFLVEISTFLTMFQEKQANLGRVTHYHY